MTRTLANFPYCFTHEVPSLSIWGASTPIAASGQLMVSGQERYVFVFIPTAATIGMSPNLYADPDLKSVASGHPTLATRELHSPLIDDIRRLRNEENVARKPTKEEIARMRIDTFLAEVYLLAGSNNLDGATDKIFNVIDRLLCDGLSSVVDEILRKVDVDRLPTALMRSFLSITAPAKGPKLPSRPALYRRIEEKMKQLRGPEKTQRIIGSLA